MKIVLTEVDMKTAIFEYLEARSYKIAKREISYNGGVYGDTDSGFCIEVEVDSEKPKANVLSHLHHGTPGARSIDGADGTVQKLNG